MKLTFLGTAAAEGFPALFCNCDFCVQARKLGGKNIRTRSQALINEDLLLDFPADTYYHFLQNGIEGHRIRYLLVTHSHSDHLYSKDLCIRGGAYAHEMAAPTLEVIGSEGACRAISQHADHLHNVTFRSIAPFETVQFGGYTVTALPARHMSGDNAVFYIIKGDKTILYAHDTGFFLEEVFSYLEKERIVLDLVSLDCTNVDIPVSDEGTHMGFENIGRLLQRLEAMGAVSADTVKYVNHFSHNGNPLHSLLEARAAQLGCRVSYDGLGVEL